MQTVAETIFDIVKVLPETKQREVLEFVSDLKDERQDGLADFVKFVEERSKLVPEEAWDDLPSDSSINLDHYLYGSKKK